MQIYFDNSLAGTRAPQAVEDAPDSKVLIALPGLAAVRKERGETLAAVSERSGVSISQLSRLERGLNRCSPEVMAALAQALEVGEGGLLEDTD